MKEHDTVVLTRSLPEHDLQVGDVGAIVHVYSDGKSYEVEFVEGSGTTVAVATLRAADIRPVSSGEILHVRDVAA